MAELRSVDPRALKPNPDNPRRTPVPKEMDHQLAASITAIGLLQPPVVREIDGALVIRAGDRRTRAAIAAGLATIDVYVLDGPETIDPMATMSENLVRVGMNPVDTWRGIDRLEKQSWNEEAIANALALPPKTVRKLKLLGQVHPPMLDVMAKGSMPRDEELRTIANAPLADQEQVWKKLKPRKGHETNWWEVSRALSRTRIPFSAARFDAKLGEEYGVIWVEDLFAPAGEDGRYTINADGFFAAQEAWMRENLPANGTVLTIGEHGQPELPKKAERIWGKPGKHDKIGHFVNPRSGEVETVAYREAEPKQAKTRAKRATKDATSPPETPAKSRPDLTQKGEAIVGDYRTDALHQALRDGAIDDTTLVALLTLALAGSNVSIDSGLDTSTIDRAGIITPIVEGGALTADAGTIRSAARFMLAYALSCRANMSSSGAVARVAGVAIGADRHLPHMATEAFLSCLSRQALERSAANEAVAIGARVKDTRAALIKRFDGTTWHFPGALFGLTPEEVRGGITPSGRYVRGLGGNDGVDEDEFAPPTDPMDAIDPDPDPDTTTEAGPYQVAAE
jgi:ParB/RepB/Spo0J family partition protein